MRTGKWVSLCAQPLAAALRLDTQIACIAEASGRVLHRAKQRTQGWLQGGQEQSARPHSLKFPGAPLEETTDSPPRTNHVV